VSAIIALLLFLQPAPPFSARYLTPTSARLSWQQPSGVALTCLYRATTLIRCWRDLPAGPTFTTIGDVASFNGNLRPHAGDVYILTLDDAEWQARLASVARLALVRR